MGVPYAEVRKPIAQELGRHENAADQHTADVTDEGPFDCEA
jgi:hypothetical protein